MDDLLEDMCRSFANADPDVASYDALPEESKERYRQRMRAALSALRGNKLGRIRALIRTTG